MHVKMHGSGIMGGWFFVFGTMRPKIIHSAQRRRLRRRWMKDAITGTVVSVEVSGVVEEEVFDLEVEGNNNFFADGILVHNCHHVVADKLRALVERVPAALRWGLTATPFREDGLGKVMEWVVGPVVYDVSQRELADAGHLVLPKVRKIESGWECPEGINPSDDWNGMVAELIRDEHRNMLIGRTILSAMQKHNRILVLTVRKIHARYLAQSLTIRGQTDVRFGAHAVDSDMPKRERQEKMDAFRDGAVRVVCAVNIADEGLNVPALDCVVIAGPVKAKAKSIQRLGRLMRPVEGKAPMLYDVVDGKVPHLQRQWYARRRAYKEVLGG